MLALGELSPVQGFSLSPSPNLLQPETGAMAVYPTPVLQIKKPKFREA